MVALPSWMAPAPMPGPRGITDGAWRPVPLGRRVELPGRGSIFVREVAGPPGAPTVVLLHGWVASAGLNWFRAFSDLGRYFHVIAPDLRGHGRGIRSWRPFRLADCADDVAALLSTQGVGPVIAVGYSMGGPVAQLLWWRHRALVAGLVLCATAPSFADEPSSLPARAGLTAAAGASRLGGFLTQPVAEGVRHLVRPAADRSAGFREWALAELRRHDVRMLFAAGHAVLTFDAWRWIGDVDVPTAVVATTRDRAVSIETQTRMAAAIRDATIHPVDDGHTVCARPHFTPPLVAACLDVTERVTRRA
jgi:3-oxoadipate enol-lactonase